jgi:D-alanyl-D-alanine carboxypeptidase/D-alanyl-D-alanine-endopeptidase (penicillin-binding protein 4)
VAVQAARAGLGTLLLALAGALGAAGAPQRPDALPPEVDQALQRARIPASVLAVVVRDAASGREVLAHNESRPVNPASLAKLIVTTAALEQLGPAWTWVTPVWLQGPVRDGVLDGSVFVRGSGDPKLVIERVWLLLRRIQQAGVREIRGDIVLDNGAFVLPPGSAADFDGQPTRPYNVRPSALLLNYHVVTYTFVPDATAGVARVIAEPELAATTFDRSVPLASGPCEDWAGALKAVFEPGRTRFTGRFPAACGTLSWPVADPHPASYNARLVDALWREMGGRLGGQVREGNAPTATPPSFELRSPPLLEVAREINKFSNNVMADNLALTLAAQAAGPGRPATPAMAREHLQRWLEARIGELPGETVLDNGSGLSRSKRIGAAQLAQLLQRAYDGPTMSELMSSLPISGVDGTMRRARATPGRAHLKTGSLDEVSGRAGYVLSDSGRRYVLVVVVNHERAQAARPALDALLAWVMRDAPPR